MNTAYLGWHVLAMFELTFPLRSHPRLLTPRALRRAPAEVRSHQLLSGR